MQGWPGVVPLRKCAHSVTWLTLFACFVITITLKIYDQYTKRKSQPTSFVSHPFRTKSKYMQGI